MKLTTNFDSFTSSNVKPFLRWAGGKNWLVKHLPVLLRNIGFKNYHEPFLGGGAVFFSLFPKGKSFLSDLNGDLIKTYKTIQTNAPEVIEVLKTFKNTEEYYYRVRNTHFKTSVETAAKFIYLNQTSYNGIYRVNLKGVYNVPYGFRTKNFLNVEVLKSAQLALKSSEIEKKDFDEIIDNVRKKDLVFLDPPYTVSHNNNGFIKYNEKIFSLQDQIRLSKLIDKVKRKNAYYILTNAAHPTLEQIFEKGDLKLNFKRASLIGGTNSERKQVNEFVFTNIIQK